MAAVAAVLLVAASAGAYQFGAFDGLLKKRAALKSVLPARLRLPPRPRKNPITRDRGREARQKMPSLWLRLRPASRLAPSKMARSPTILSRAILFPAILLRKSAANQCFTDFRCRAGRRIQIDASASRTAANSKVTVPAKSSGKPLLYSRVAAAAKVGNHSKSQLGPAATTSAPKTASNSVPPAPAPTAASANSTPDAPAEVSTAAESYVGPKLVKSVKPVAPPKP